MSVLCTDRSRYCKPRLGEQGQEYEMAKAEFTCAECGASSSVTARNRSEADRLAAYYEQQGRLCSTCYQKARERESVRAAAEAKAVATEGGWPALEGTEKQIQWAETLRATTLSRAERALIGAFAVGCSLTAIKTDEENDAAEARLTTEMERLPCSEADRRRATSDTIELLKLLRDPEKVDMFVGLMREKSRASWWIDMRDISLEMMAKSMKSEIDDHMARSEAPAISADVVAAVEAESLLKPVGNPVDTAIAEVSLVGNDLRVAMPAKHEEFRLLMRGMGFTWAQTTWSKTMGLTHGDPIDRMADVAHRIIGKGFMVRVHDNVARGKAISGDFLPEQTRWVTKRTGQPFDGWCCITWSKSDDLYQPARSLPGSKYKDGAVFVPPSFVLEVDDFAEKYGFSLSPGVQQMLATHREAIARGTVIANPKEAPVAIVETSNIPKKLDVPANQEVDNELLDRD